MQKLILFLSALLILLLAGCQIKPESRGDFDTISVFADSLDWPDYKPALKEVFSREYKTPALESEFLLKWRSSEFFKQYQHDRNIIFLARLDSDDPVSTVVKNTLPGEILEGVADGKYFSIPKHDPWAEDQYLLFLVAPTKKDLIRKIEINREIVYQDFIKAYYDRYKKQLYRRYENSELEDYLLEHFPFKVRVPSDYFVADESENYGYVYLRRLHPDRSITVHWIPYSDTANLSFDWVVKQRNKLAKLAYQGDRVVEEETTIYETTFLEWKAVRLQGTWKNPSLVIGGPFRNIVFIDKQSGLIFMIDYYVQAIGRRKKLFLDQLEIIANTFQTKAAIEAGKISAEKEE